MNNLIVRAITGALFVAVILGSIFWNETASFAVLSGFMILGIIEFYKLFNNNENIDIDWRIGLGMSVLIFGLLSVVNFGHLPSVILWSIVPIILVFMLIELWREKKNPILNIAVLLFGMVYLITPFMMTIMLNHGDVQLSSNYIDYKQIPLIAGMFILVWTNDTFAYLSGRAFGKTKLFERISPKKTWEGTVGGVILTIGVSYLLSMYTDASDAVYWMVAGAIVSICAILGDLLESLFKRSLDVKDSGTILPGHGGILDRFDAMLFAAPFFVAWTYLYIYFA